MKRLTYIMLVLFSCILSACTQDEPKNNDDHNSSKDVTMPVGVVNDEFINSIVKIEPLSDVENCVTLTNKTPSSLIPAIGHIFVIPQCKIAPFGFSGIVKKVIYGENIEIITESPSLDSLSSEFNLDCNNLDVSIFDVEDEEGNHIQYTCEPQNSRASHSFENMIVKFPFEVKIPESDKITINGDAYLGFNKFAVSLLKEVGRPLVSTFDIEPTVGLNINSTIGIKSNKKYSKRVGQVRFVIKGTIPPRIPVIIPVTLYVYAEIGLDGEITASFSLNPHYDGQFRISSETGEWKSSKIDKDYNQKTPWGFSTFDVKGNISMGMKCGVMIGLYSASTGIGLNFTPQYSVSAEASLASTDLFKINPIVTNNISIESEIYCVASFFGRELGKHSLKFPSAVLWEEKLTLFPEIKSFTAQIVDKNTGFISYQRGKHFFLENLAASEGLSLFLHNTENHIDDYNSDIIREDDSFIYKEKHLHDLKGKTTYYVCPYYEIFGRKFLGESKKITTEESYENRKYRVTLLSCDYDKLIPPLTSFTLDVTVASDGKFLSREYPEKEWKFKDKLVDYGSLIKRTEEYIKVRFFTYYNHTKNDKHCINPQHNHSEPNTGIAMRISYNYLDYDWINGQMYNVYRDERCVTFYLDSSCGSFTPCKGYYVDSKNYLYDHIYNAFAKLERIE